MMLDTLLAQSPQLEKIDYYFSQEFAVEQLGRNDALHWQVMLMLLSMRLRQGHSCLAVADLADKPWLNEVTPTDCFPDESHLTRLVTLALQSERVAGALVFERGMLYTRRYYQFELDVVSAINQRSELLAFDHTALCRCKTIWPVLFDAPSSEQVDWQQVAVAKALIQRFAIISGGPGTGKTYTVTRLMLALQTLSEQDLTIVMAAPTGKAAQRLSESVAQAKSRLDGVVNAQLLDRIPTTAQTLHRLLGVRQYGVATRFNQNNPLDIDVLIVDEASMIDLALMARLMRALRPHTRLYLVGDANQLPAVETGNVLEALSSERLNHDTSDTHATLNQHVRQLCPDYDREREAHNTSPWTHHLKLSRRFSGKLSDLAHAINAGNSERAWQLLCHVESGVVADMPDDTVTCMTLPDSVRALRALAKQTVRWQNTTMTPEQAFDAANQFRWLTPVKAGEFGVHSLNQLITEQCAHYSGMASSEHFKGRVVMVTQNHYSHGLFNGDIGVVWPDPSGRLKAWFKGENNQMRAFSLARLPTVETAFAMTVHKSQGSEYDNVIMVLPDPAGENSGGLYHRALLYTGLTRAKQRCLIISQMPTFKAMVETKDQRFSGLAARISEAS